MLYFVGLCMLMKWVDKEKLNKNDEFGTAIHKVK